MPDQVLRPVIRPATVSDCAAILNFIKELACYEKLEHLMVGTATDLERTLFCDTPHAKALIVEEAGTAVGFALYFYSYSTFLCRYGIYVEDLYIQETCRGKGYGKALLKHICEEAVKNNCGRVEWQCLDWNTPAIEFYLKLGATPMSDWTVYRLDRDKIEQVICMNTVPSIGF